MRFNVYDFAIQPILQIFLFAKSSTLNRMKLILNTITQCSSANFSHTRNCTTSQSVTHLVRNTILQQERLSVGRTIESLAFWFDCHAHTL